MISKTSLGKKIKEKISKLPKNELYALLGVIFTAAFLRLYRISEYMTFLGDEGRDAIVVRRLLVDLNPILIGPGTSVGDMYLGPLYYYLIALPLALANFSPVGPAVFVALVGVATVFLVWLIGREWFGRYAAFFAAFFYAVSPVVIVHARFSWNPNVMPFFALLVVYSLWRVWKRQEFAWFVVLGICFPFVLQSHYMGLALLPLIILFGASSKVRAWPNKKERLTYFKYLILGTAIFAFLMSPLVIFDARHGWRNFSSMKLFFSQRETAVSVESTTLSKTWPTWELINTRLVSAKNEEVGRWVSLAFMLLLGKVIYEQRRQRGRRFSAFLLLVAWLGFGVLGLSLYKKEIFDHYYGFLFPAPFLLLGGLAGDIIKKGRKLMLLGLFFALAVLFYLNLDENPLGYHPNRQLQRTQKVSEKIVEAAGEERFNFSVIADRNHEGAYQYFLEAWGAPFVIIDSQRLDETMTKQLIVVCEKPEEECQPTTSPKGGIAAFGWSKIDEVWEVEGVIIYRLVHK